MSILIGEAAGTFGKEKAPMTMTKTLRRIEVLEQHFRSQTLGG